MDAKLSDTGRILVTGTDPVFLKERRRNRDKPLEFRRE